MESESVESLHFVKIRLSDGRRIFLKTEWTETGIDILAIDEDSEEKSAWKGFLPKWEIESKARDLEVPFEDFYSNTRKALTTIDERFTYEIAEGCFQWTKIGEVKVIYGSANMKKLPESPEIDIRDKMMDVVSQLRRKLEGMSGDLEKLGKDCEMYAKELDLEVKSRNDREDELLSKVVLMLNSKKRRIAALEDYLKKNCSRESISQDSEVDQDSVPNIGKYSQDSDPSSQEMNIRSIPKRQKISERLPAVTLTRNAEKVSAKVSNAAEVDTIYNKDTLDLDLIN
ncbi:uncharacterized protein LOC129799854 [Phlebotomus papatasi]|uniref:uncharacterized protein LOC129799854 n=1 Tax=Phlebotomus papatasi TaxID=29031 RepID=UPI00248336C4|nr:uncharacterized protein LOC129799854 [Phlebotomus papatasi]